MTYNIGDKVRIVNYGHLITCYPDILKHMSDCPRIGPQRESGAQDIDIRPELVGREDIVQASNFNQARMSYSLGNNGAWFDDDQLELVEANQVFKKEGV